MIRKRSNWFAAVVFLVVQLLHIVPVCSANLRTSQLQYHSSYHDAANLHVRRRDKEYRSDDNMKQSSERRQELNGHDISTYDVRLVDSIRDTSVSEDLSTARISMSDTKQLKQQQFSAPHQSVHRQTRDVEDILNEMAHKDPKEWTAVDIVVLIMFLTMFCWIYSCLCALCCCGGRGGGGGSSLLNWLCFYEICCRDGRDLDVCCDYATSTLV